MPPNRPEHLANKALMSPVVFKRFGDLITAELGIKMPDSKRMMLQSRLQKRLRVLSMQSFEDYQKYLFSSEGREKELCHMLDCVTTNKTDFFREPKHYDILTRQVLPDLLYDDRTHLRRPFKVWSAGCSTGAEPYTLAMVLSEWAERLDGFRFRILATDISTRVLEIASRAIYEERDAGPIPMACKKKYLLRSKDRHHPRIRIVPELRRQVEFRRLNFMQPDFAIQGAMDIIFCRNVIIYFDRATQQEVLQRICRYLVKGGFLFTGHSETLNGFKLPLRQIAATVYRKIC